MTTRNNRSQILLLAILVGALLLLLTGCTLRGPTAVASAAAVKLAHATPPPGGDDLRWLLLALIGVGVLGFGLSLAAAVWLPFKKAALAGCAGFSAVLVLALVVKTIQPYLGAIVCGGALALLIAAVWAAWKLHLGGRLAALYANDMASAPDDAAAAKVTADHAVAWAKAGMTAVMKHYGVRP